MVIFVKRFVGFFISKELNFYDSLWYIFVISLFIVISIYYFIYLNFFFVDGDENDWLIDLLDIKNKNILYCSVDFLRFVKKLESKIESVLFNMIVMVVGIVIGCDIIFFSLFILRDEIKNRKKRDSYILNRRDVYNVVVRDSFFDSEDSISSRFISSLGYFYYIYYGY